MADRHYGRDVRVMMIGSKNVLATFESLEFSCEPTVKESQSAQDSGPNRRIIGSDFTLSINKFLEGSVDALIDLFGGNPSASSVPSKFKDIDIQVTFSVSGSDNNGTQWKSLIFNDCVCTRFNISVGGDATKESIELKRGTGDWTWA